ncbi:hypothetical protein BJV74DRAFT_769656, partial [Russula compacta]
LTYNICDDLNNNFKELNSKLDGEVLELERRIRGSKHAAGDDCVYEPPPLGLDVETQVHILGGSGPAPTSDESIEKGRRRILQATLSRSKEEETENSCGTALASESRKCSDGAFRGHI